MVIILTVFIVFNLEVYPKIIPSSRKYKGINHIASDTSGVSIKLPPPNGDDQSRQTDKKPVTSTGIVSKASSISHHQCGNHQQSTIHLTSPSWASQSKPPVDIAVSSPSSPTLSTSPASQSPKTRLSPPVISSSKAISTSAATSREPPISTSSSTTSITSTLTSAPPLDVPSPGTPRAVVPPLEAAHLEAAPVAVEGAPVIERRPSSCGP